MVLLTAVLPSFLDVLLGIGVVSSLVIKLGVGLDRPAGVALSDLLSVLEGSVDVGKDVS